MTESITQIQEDLAESSVARAFKAVSARGESGLLAVQHGGVVRQITLRNGRPVFAASTNRENRLNGVLLRHGLVTLRELIESAIR